MVVIVAPDGQFPAGVGQAVEQFLVEQLIAQRAVEALDEPVLLGPTGIDVVPLDPILACPFQDRPTGKFGPIVTDNAGRLAVETRQRVEFTRHAGPGYAGIGNQTQVLAAAIIIDGQNPEFARRVERVRHEVRRPPRARSHRHVHRCAAAPRPFAAAPAAHRQAFFPVQPVELLVAHDHPLTFEHDADLPVAKATALTRDVLHGVTDSAVVRRAFTPNRLGIDTNQPAGPVSSDFSRQILQDGVIQHAVSQKPFQLAVLVPQLA